MNRIKELLQAKGMSQTELAHRLGKCFNTVTPYAANKVHPHPRAVPDSRHPQRGCERVVDPIEEREVTGQRLTI